MLKSSMTRRRYFAVEITDPDPRFGGKTIKVPFAYREQAELWAREEVEAAAELGIVGCTYRIFETVLGDPRR